jgi:hypothetical protein
MPIQFENNIALVERLLSNFRWIVNRDDKDRRLSSIAKSYKRQSTSIRVTFRLSWISLD